MYQANLNEFRSARAATLGQAAGLTDHQASFTSGPGKWSAGEVLDHLLLAEQLYRDKFAQMIAMQKAGQKAEIRSSFSEINTSVMYIPLAALPLPEAPFRMMNLFVPTAVRETLTRYRVMPAQAPSIAKPRPGRPVAEQRHREQIRNILRSPSFPPPR